MKARNISQKRDRDKDRTWDGDRDRDRDRYRDRATTLRRTNFYQIHDTEGHNNLDIAMFCNKTNDDLNSIGEQKVMEDLKTFLFC
ncbi:hypothetical protein HZH68_004687 [Vespula germanica]|uniref:Uncharacterized protein n=1 Tax=Vespula germanica TaxID=30212 RepID=A0A834KR14_VESGE|nr:hypothetical protein HZH68_004687 [Vespula germanica]